MFFGKFMVLITNPQSEFTFASLVRYSRSKLPKGIIWGFLVVFSVSIWVPVHKSGFLDA